MSRARIVIEITEPYHPKDDSMASRYGAAQASVEFRNGRGDQHAALVSRSHSFDGDEARSKAILAAVEDVLPMYARLAA